MSDIKVRSLEEDAPEVKITSEVPPQEEEQKVEEKQEETVEETTQDSKEEQVEETKVESPAVEEEVQEEVKEEPQEVLSNTEQKDIELPEDVKSFLKFREETGRGMDDYVKLNINYDEMDQADLLRQYVKQEKPHFDEDDISYYIESNFVSNEDDDENVARRKKLDLKETIYKAKQHFNKLKEDYYTPVESTGQVPEDYQEAFSFYSDYKKKQEKQELLSQKRGQYFLEQTNKLYDQIEGFEFDLGDSKQVYKINDKESAKNKRPASMISSENF